jgi:hypothetical protein
LGGFFMLVAQGLQLGDPSAGFFSMTGQLSDVLHSFVEILVQGMCQLHLIWQASHTITTSGRHHLSIDSCTGSAQKVPILGMLNLVIFLVAHCNQGFMCIIMNSALKHPPRGDSLDHLANTADTIDHRTLVHDHPYVPEVGVPS